MYTVSIYNRWKKLQYYIFRNMKLSTKFSRMGQHALFPFFYFLQPLHNSIHAVFVVIEVWGSSRQHIAKHHTVPPVGYFTLKLESELLSFSARTLSLQCIRVYFMSIWKCLSNSIIFSSMETHKRMNRSYPSVIHRLQQHNIFEYARCREGSNFHVQ